MLCKANYYDFYTSDHRIVDVLVEAVKEFDLAKGAIPAGLKTYAYTKLAKAYCQCSRFEEAMRTYKECFALWGDELKRNHYHMLMYSVIAIIAHEFDEAQKMLDNFQAPNMTATPDVGMQFNIARNYAILHLHRSEYSQAFEHMQMFLQLRRSATDLLGDILNRLVHNAYFVLTGDLETALKLIEKNKKFLRSKGKTALTNQYDGYFSSMRDIIRYKYGIAKLPTDFDKQMESYQEGIMKLYGDLLVKMLQKKHG